MTESENENDQMTMTILTTPPSKQARQCTSLEKVEWFLL